MFSVTSGNICGVITEKKYEFDVAENPELVEHCKRFLVCSVSCPGSVSFGFFQELQNKVACTGCKNPSFYLKKMEKKKEAGCASDGDCDHDCDSEESRSFQNEYFCAICYVRRFCNVHTFQNQDGSDTYYIFKAKSSYGSSGGILYQSSPIIERPL